jgi:hypothetical protein
VIWTSGRMCLPLPSQGMHVQLALLPGALLILLAARSSVFPGVLPCHQLHGWENPQWTAFKWKNPRTEWGICPAMFDGQRVSPLILGESSGYFLSHLPHFRKSWSMWIRTSINGWPATSQVVASFLVSILATLGFQDATLENVSPGQHWTAMC